MNRVGVMSFPDALRKKPFREADWRFLGMVLIFLILLAALVALGDTTLDFPEPVLSAETASFYVDMILSAEEVGLEKVEEPETTEGLGETAAAEDEELPPEEVAEEEVAAPEESVVEASQREEEAREERRQAAGARVAQAKAAQAAALEQSGLLALLTVATPAGGGTGPGTGTSGTGPGAADGGAFGVADLGTDFAISSDLSKDRRVSSRVKAATKKDLKVQMAKAKELTAKMTEAEIEAAAALADAQLEVKMSGPSKVEEIARTTPGRDPDAIEAMITRHRAQIAHCYETELRKTPGLEGKIVVRFTVRANGRVTGAKVIQSTMGNAKVERCIVGVIRRFKFDVVGREKGNLTYEYPFIFTH